MRALRGLGVLIVLGMLAGVFSSTIPVRAEPMQTKLSAEDPAAIDWFGYAVSISGNTVVVGAPNDDGVAGSDQGSAHVFVRSGTSWNQQARLTADNAAEGERFGYAVSISGDTILVGAPDDGVAADEGSAYVFVRGGATWSQQARLTAEDPIDNDAFGFSVSVSGDSAVIGTPTGAAYVFAREGTTWSQQAKLTPEVVAVNDAFGYAVSISDDTVVVGAPNDDHATGFDQGSAYVFVRLVTTWSQQGKLTADDASDGDYFGLAVSISGETIVVAAPIADLGTIPNRGSAYVFVRQLTTWSQQAKLTAEDSAEGDDFGRAVCISGDTVVVGAPSDDHATGFDEGSSYVFVRGGTTWSQEARLTADDAAARDQFGFAVSLSGNTVVVGAPYDWGVAEEQGSAYIIEPVPELEVGVLEIEITGEFDYVPREPVRISVAALVRDAKTGEPVSGADVTIEIYNQAEPAELVVSATMDEVFAGKGVYRWTSSGTVGELRATLPKGVYLAVVEAKVAEGRSARAILEFHIDPPEEATGPQFSSVDVAIAVAATAMLTTFVLRRAAVTRTLQRWRKRP